MPADRLPPHDLDAEEAVIGSLLIDGAAMYKIADFLKDEQFYYATNQLLYRACYSLFSRSEAIDQVTVAQELARENRLEMSGGAANLSRLISICPTSLDLENYANIVYRLYVNREMVKAGNRIIEIGYDARPDVDSSLNDAEGTLVKLRDHRPDQDLIHINKVLDAYLEPPTPRLPGEPPPFVLSNMPEVDNILHGFQRSNLIIVAGRPGMGKTSFALSMARNIAVEQKATVAIFSLEMSREELVMRLLSAEANVDSQRLNFWRHEEDARTEDQERRIMKAVGTLSEAPIFIDDSPSLKVFELRSKARRLHRERGLDLIVIDHLGLMQGDGKNGGGENRVQEISYISRNLKSLSRDLKVPIMAISQLSRASEKRDDRVPKLPDLRDSGSIEQDADVVMFIYREGYYETEEQWKMGHPGQPFPKEEADIIVAKHRNGPTGKAKLRFIANTARFESITIQAPVPGPVKAAKLV